MKEQNKIQISSDFIFIKLLSLSGVCLFIKLLLDENKNNLDIDFKTDLEYKIFLFGSFVSLIYFFTRPRICHDDTNLYIKRINQKEVTIPFKKIKSLFNNPLTYKGRSTFSIEFVDSDNEMGSIKFNINYYSKKISNFISTVKTINPNVQIV